MPMFQMIRDPSLMLMVLCLVGVNTIIIIAWQTIDPYVVTAKNITSAKASNSHPFIFLLGNVQSNDKYKHILLWKDSDGVESNICKSIRSFVLNTSIPVLKNVLNKNV